MDKNYIFDFDSTFTKVEALDLLVEISQTGNPNIDAVKKEIANITNLGIDGDITFTESLERRIQLLDASKADLGQLVERLKQNVSTSIESNRAFFQENKEHIYIVSAGFREFIVPVVADYGISEDRVYANTFVYEGDRIVGFDRDNVLSKHSGKVDCIRNLQLSGEVQVVGDGYSDYLPREQGVADTFFAFVENVERAKTIQNADHVISSLDEFLYINELPGTVSYPKKMIKILLLENIHPDAAETFRRDGFTVETLSTGLSEDELIDHIQDVHVLGIRSKTKVTRKVVENAPKLFVVGTFCIGTKQIDLEACKEHGIVVFNAPYSNTRSVVELAIGEIIMLMRSVFQRSTEIHNGTWNKTAQGSNEVRGKKLGIIGYGNIGKQLSVLAESIGMDVYYYDIEDQLALGNATKVNSLPELLAISDAVSLHLDDNPQNKNFISAEQFAQMKDGAVFLNLARGFVVDIAALVEALKSGKISGAAVDVYPVEPKQNGDFYTELKGIPNVILTPHVGGSTMEAQKHIGSFVPGKILGYINSGNTVDAVNFPNVRLPEHDGKHRFLHIHQNISGVMANINKILAEYDINISGQYLSTDEKVGYVITDVDKNYNRDVLDRLKSVGGTIRFRVLY